jgi:pimeloyl-ACP methyl ester carboxylesterase
MLHVTEHGEREAAPVVLLHGQMLGADIFDALVLRLAPRHRVLVPDLPGHGRSPLPEPYSFARVQEALRDALRARGIESAALVGYSLGAYHALALALAGSPGATRLVLIGPVAGIDAPVRETYRGYAAAVRAGLKAGLPFAELAVPDGLAAARPSLRAEIAARVDAVDPRTHAAELEAIAALEDLRPRLGAIRVPTVVRVGDLDRNTPEAAAREIVRAIPGARLEVAAGVGHLYLEQDAEGTLASVERALA